MAMPVARKGIDREAVRELLEGGPPLAVTYDEPCTGGAPAFLGHLLVDAFGTKAGTRVTFAQAPHFSGRWTLQEALAGNAAAPALRKGDVVAFPSAYLMDGVAWVSTVSARTHDALRGPVQVMTAMARPSQARVSKKGASQWLTMTDGKSASVARSYDEITAVFNASRSREWPGGSPGLIIRDRNGGIAEFFEEKDSGIDHLIQELTQMDCFADPKDALEIVPAWRLPMGREQVTRDVDPRQETPKPVSGPFSSRFQTGKYRAHGFLPCLVIVCDEDEWAFGGKTGKRVRVAHGVQPVFRREAVLAERLPTSVRACGGQPNTILCMHSQEALMADAARRAAMDAPAVPRNEERTLIPASRGITGLRKSETSFAGPRVPPPPRAPGR